MNLYFKVRFNLRAKVPPEIEKLPPPYLILPNHQGFWDPFMIGSLFKYPIFYITSDAVFRYPLLNFFMNLLGAIPKKKAQSDLESIKNIMKIKNAGGIIGVFPEGGRTWDGVTLPLIESTSKLIKLLKVPVVTAVFKGGYYSQPRWGKNIQKGKVTINFNILFNKEEIKLATVKEIHRKMSKALFFDEIEYQQKEKILYKGKNPAEHIEQALFMCPSCKKTGTLLSKRDSVLCTECGYSVTLNAYRELESSVSTPLFTNIRDWNRWQIKELEELLKKISSNSTIFKNSHLTIHTGKGTDRMKHLFHGKAELSPELITLRNSSGIIVKQIPVNELIGINVQNKEKLDFYYNGKVYNIFDRKKRFSAYGWLIAIQYLQRNQKS